MGHSIKRTVWLVGRLLLVALAADLLRPVATFAIPPVVESFLSLSDVTTANSSTSKHGFLKKLDNTATHYMDGTGAWSTPAGGFVLLEEHTASSSATLDFTTAFTSAYDEYQIEILNLLPATNNVSVQYLMSSNGGSTWDTGTNYNNNLNIWLVGVNAVTSDNAQTAGTVQNNINNTAGYGLCMSLKLMNPLSTTLNKGLSGTGTSTDGSSGLRMIGWTVANWYVNTTAAVNAMRFQMSSGNIASGTIRVYGLAK